jgi:hypothetical protein
MAKCGRGLWQYQIAGVWVAAQKCKLQTANCNLQLGLLMEEMEEVVVVVTVTLVAAVSSAQRPLAA